MPAERDFELRLRELEIVVGQLAKERSHLEGYVDGRLQSITTDLKDQAAEVERELLRFRTVFYGENGKTPGVPERLRQHDTKLERHDGTFRWLVGVGTGFIVTVTVVLLKGAFG